jgi:hypothetical protein
VAVLNHTLQKIKDMVEEFLILVCQTLWTNGG